MVSLYPRLTSSPTCMAIPLLTNDIPLVTSSSFPPIIILVLLMPDDNYTARWPTLVGVWCLALCPVVLAVKTPLGIILAGKMDIGHGWQWWIATVTKARRPGCNISLTKLATLDGSNWWAVPLPYKHPDITWMALMRQPSTTMMMMVVQFPPSSIPPLHIVACGDGQHFVISGVIPIRLSGAQPRH